MTLFEYLMVMVALILGLGATQILRGLARIARSSRRYVVVTLWAVIFFYIAIQNWWALWDLNDLTRWDQGRYLFLVMLPCLLYGAIELLLPFNVPADMDWRSHFYSVRPWLFGVLSVYVVFAALQSWLLNDASLLHPYRVAQGGALLVALLGWATSRPAVHLWLPWVYIALVGGGNLLYRLAPASL